MIGVTYKYSTTKESYKQVVVVNPNAVQSHGAMMIIPHTTPVTDTAMVHAWKLVNLAFLAESPPLLALYAP